ncbi:MAG TPA: magnesium transporter [Cellvibrionaceae bacterium]|nr:magnesium transporter [Cellvibrionaceae bacterium]
MAAARSDNLQDTLEPIFALLQKQELVESLAHRQSGSANPLVEQLVHRQHEAELRRKLHNLNAADIAHLLDMLPQKKRLLVWSLVSDQQAAECLLELSENSLHHVFAETPAEQLKNLLGRLEADELAVIADFVPEDVLTAVKAGLESGERDWLETTLNYDEESVGSLMSRDSLVVYSSWTVDQAIDSIRQLDELPEQTDQVFVVNEQRVLVGALPLTALLRHRGQEQLKTIMNTQVVRFLPTTEGQEAALAFERYDLICAPVVDERGRIIGRLTVETIMDFVREQNEHMELAKQGLSARADLLDPIWQGAQTRWLWLAINLITAFCATRFIALFASSIESLVALATLMPIVASIGGNAGQQTAALMVRSLSLDQIHKNNLPLALGKEIAVSLINGLIWGSLLGAVAAAIYGNLGLGLVMLAAICLNLLIAAVAGIFTPLLINNLGRDPAMGTSVILTFITDSMGFFIFLGLATLWLI